MFTSNSSALFVACACAVRVKALQAGLAIRMRLALAVELVTLKRTLDVRVRLGHTEVRSGNVGLHDKKHTLRVIRTRFRRLLHVPQAHERQ